jgi:hypothetical protein
MSKPIKYYTSSHISQQYAKLSDKERVEVLSQALDYMSQFNGRSRFLCIAMGMGYHNTEGETNTYFRPNQDAEDVIAKF